MRESSSTLRVEVLSTAGRPPLPGWRCRRLLVEAARLIPPGRSLLRRSSPRLIRHQNAAHPSLRRSSSRLIRHQNAAPERGRGARGDGQAPSVTVRFAGPSTMRALNARFRGRDRPTDVLSFPARADSRPARTPDGPHLGDLAIGVEAARRQARRRGHPLAREVEILILHGYLHLLGYDHDTDSGEMERLEGRLRRRLGLRSPRSPA